MRNAWLACKGSWILPTHAHCVYLYVHRFICTVWSPCFECALSIKLSITQTFTRYSNSIRFYFTCYYSPWWFILLKRLQMFSCRFSNKIHHLNLWEKWSLMLKKSYNMNFMYLINYLQICNATKSLFPKGKQLFICVEYGRHGHVFHVPIYLWMFYCNRIKSSFSIKEAFTFYLDFILSNLFSGIFSWCWLSHSSNLGLSFQCLTTKRAAFLSINSSTKSYIVCSHRFHLCSWCYVMSSTGSFYSGIYVLGV